MSGEREMTYLGRGEGENGIKSSVRKVNRPHPPMSAPVGEEAIHFLSPLWEILSICKSGHRNGD